MALSIIQNPADVSLAQSPIAFAVSESNANVFTSSSMQYIAELYFWTGSTTDSGSSANYTLQKYPNTSRTGIFDVSRIINSELSDIVQEVSSSVRYFAIDAYTQYLSGSTFLTGSHVRSNTFKAIDGYSLFQEPISQSINQKTDYWPMMTDVDTTQSYQDGNYGRLAIWKGAGSDLGTTQLIYSGNLDDNNFLVTTGQTNTKDMVSSFPISPLEPDWPLDPGTSEFSVQAFAGSSAVSEKLNFKEVCQTKYDNIRIKWKNRYGQFDYFNFNLVSRQSMSTSRQRYQPQIGSWNNRTLTYQQYENSVQNYIVDSDQTLSVNTDYVNESYNDIFKQLMVSDEIYWITKEGTYITRDDETLMPLALQSTSFAQKTEKVDKLIQYSFDFIRGQGYKLII